MKDIQIHPISSDWLNKKEVESISIHIRWVKSRTWGHNPHGTAFVRYTDGTYQEVRERCSGCGYDKLSTVVADILQKTMGDFLMEKMEGKEERKDFPYGIQRGHFSGGIGIGCYEDKSESYGGEGIMQFLGYRCRYFPGKDTDFILIERKETNEKR